MKIFLVGATGRTGKWILRAALARGHQVTALVREPTGRLTTSPNLRVVAGDLLATEDLAHVLAGHDAILSALSSRAVEDGTRKIVAEAKKAGVTRFLGLAGGGILQLDEERLRRDRPGYPEIFIRSSARHLEAWRMLEASPLAWTLVCTPDLIDAAATGLATARADFMPAGSNSVPTGDVAEFFLDELEAERFLRKRVGFTR